MTVTNRQIVVAHSQLVDLYKAAVPALVGNLRARTGINLDMTPRAVVSQEPYDFRDGIQIMLEKVKETGVLQISGLHDSSLYPGDGNVWFRYAHDLTHLLYALGFDYADEMRVHQYLWAYVTQTAAWFQLDAEQQQRVKAVYDADTIGQTKYERKHGRFPIDQGAFTIQQVKRRLRNAQA